MKRRTGTRSSLRLKIASMQTQNIFKNDLGKGNLSTKPTSSLESQLNNANRTVEMLSSENIVGEERTKLLFVMSLGLIPKSDQTHRQGPIIRMEKLNLILDTKIKITEESVRTENTSTRIPESSSSSRRCTFPPATGSINNENIELVDLVSSSDDEFSVVDEKIVPTLNVRENLHRRSEKTVVLRDRNGENESRKRKKFNPSVHSRKRRCNPRDLGDSSCNISHVKSLCPEDAITID